MTLRVAILHLNDFFLICVVGIEYKAFESANLRKYLYSFIRSTTVHFPFVSAFITTLIEKTPCNSTYMKHEIVEQIER